MTAQEHEVFPAPNAAVLAEVAGADAIIYAMGSLYTSICPSLVLQVLFSETNLHPVFTPIALVWPCRYPFIGGIGPGIGRSIGGIGPGMGRSIGGIGGSGGSRIKG